jgi:hypothetical protein
LEIPQQLPIMQVKRFPAKNSMTLGIISDTHGLLRPEALDALTGVDHILHAGDIGAPEIIPRLEALAPVTAIRGNVDRAAWASTFPSTALVELGGKIFYLVHALEWLDLDPAAAGFDAVIHGHSHQPARSEKEGLLYFNPGSAGPRRFQLPVCLAKLWIRPGGEMETEWIYLI